MRLLLGIIGLLVFSTLTVRAEIGSAERPPFDQWIEAVKEEAIANGISSDTVHGALDYAMLDQKVIDLDHKQPEHHTTFDDYTKRVVSAERLSLGHQLYLTHRARLEMMQKKYGVPPQILISLWGIESSFGKNSGKFNIIDSLLTLAYEDERSVFFRKELIAALRILDQEHMRSSELRGSWAGALGQCQFMPSTYLAYAVDYNHKNKRDIWGNEDDVLASMANYLKELGWKANQLWGREVELALPISQDKIGLDHHFKVTDWEQFGVKLDPNFVSHNKDQEASLIQPDGPGGRSFLVYDNFRVLMKWNRSTYFATSVGLMANKLKRM